MNWNSFYPRRWREEYHRNFFEVIDAVVTELTTVEPVTLTEVKTQLHLTDTENDTELTDMIKRARLQIEHYTRRSLIYKRVQLVCDIRGEWWLPFPPIIGIEGVESQDSNVGSGMPAFATSENQWTATGGKFETSSYLRQRITYTAGYTACPADLKAAVLAQIYWLYEHKGNEIESLKLSTDAMGLADPYRRLEWT